jgi:competence protein ComEA
MIHSHLIRTHTRTAVAARDILSIRPKIAIAAAFLVLALGVSVLTGSPAVHAQEPKPTATSTATPAARSAAKPAAGRVNINTADAQTLAASLKGVGETRAQEIVRYREAYGPFASADELMEVKGIGQSTLDMNRDVITLE